LVGAWACRRKRAPFLFLFFYGFCSSGQAVSVYYSMLKKEQKEKKKKLVRANCYGV
jgi:aerobic-type carbon monoxide dehydrogenase small subunit (CoxS/CutS family)